MKLLSNDTRGATVVALTIGEAPSDKRSILLWQKSGMNSFSYPHYFYRKEVVEIHIDRPTSLSAIQVVVADIIFKMSSLLKEAIQDVEHVLFSEFLINRYSLEPL